MKVVCWSKDPALFVHKTPEEQKISVLDPAEVQKNTGFTKRPSARRREEQYEDFTLIFIRK